MVGWHHRLNRHEFEQTPGDWEGQGSLVSCSPCGHKEPNTTELLNNNKNNKTCNITSWPNGGRCVERGLRSLEMRYRGCLQRMKVASQPSFPGNEGFLGPRLSVPKSASPGQSRTHFVPHGLSHSLLLHGDRPLPGLKYRAGSLPGNKD